MSESLVLWVYLALIIIFSKYEHKEGCCSWRGKDTGGGNKDHPHTPAPELRFMLTQLGLHDGEMRTTLVQMREAISLQDQARTTQAKK